MYVTAHRIENTEGQQAIHVFLYEGGPETFEELERAQETNSPLMRLVKQDTTLPCGGNQVRSFFEALAPDHAPDDHLIQLVDRVCKMSFPPPRNEVLTAGEWIYRYDMDRSRALHWDRELEDLINAYRRAEWNKKDVDFLRRQVLEQVLDQVMQANSYEDALVRIRGLYDEEHERG